MGTVKQLVLLGGGHAHLFVLERLAKACPGAWGVTLVSPSSWQHYSGMLPGMMAGTYRAEECGIDLRPWVDRIGARFVECAAAGIDADRRMVCLPQHGRISYDLLSLDIGGKSDLSALAALGPRLVPVKPLPAFAARWHEIRRQAAASPGFRVAIVGGGAAGVELALAVRAGLGPSATIQLAVGESGLLRNFPGSARRHAEIALRNAQIEVLCCDAAGTPDGLLLHDGRTLKADAVLGATGVRAPVWLGLSKLALDSQGFVAVDRFQRSVSHPDVFAAGDVSTRIDVAIARSGVHAVRAGPPLAANLVAAMTGRPLRAHHPRRTRLYLLATGPWRAIASFGPWSAEGAWAWRWKNAIDRRFIARFALPSPAAPAHTD
ncbi:FAD-dependent pyridine nucleotide-disulfide oxidoreductase [Burkholderiales bacterium GJ-E10]|nr:FAD-dependent pyridine nucleotide-disulfide oxidoreductase [Burkholderiales bacterium GJ-E10]